MQENKALNTVVQPVVESLGYSFEGLEYMAQGIYSTLRIYIDRPEGVSTEDCQLISKEISVILDVEDKLSGEYNLEISSPGLDRLLFNTRQFGKYINRELKLKLVVPLNGRKSLNVTLLEVLDDEHIRVALVNDKMIFSMADIDQARLVPKW